MAVHHLTPVLNSLAAAPTLHATVYHLGRRPETGAQRVRRLQQEARALAREQVAVFAADVNALALRAEEIAKGGDAYPAGVRELAARLAADLPQKVQGLTAIMGRTAGPDPREATP